MSRVAKESLRIRAGFDENLGESNVVVSGGYVKRALSTLSGGIDQLGDSSEAPLDRLNIGVFDFVKEVLCFSGNNCVPEFWPACIALAASDDVLSVG
jgi:hypothetical protein